MRVQDKTSAGRWFSYRPTAAFHFHGAKLIAAKRWRALIPIRTANWRGSLMSASQWNHFMAIYKVSPARLLNGERQPTRLCFCRAFSRRNLFFLGCLGLFEALPIDINHFPRWPPQTGVALTMRFPHINPCFRSFWIVPDPPVTDFSHFQDSVSGKPDVFVVPFV